MYLKIIMKKLFFITICTIILTGCFAPNKTPIVAPPITPPQAYIEPEEIYDNPGSLYSTAQADGLFADTRARRVGDIVMVKIIENNTAKNKADTTADKKTTNAYGIDAFFGRESIGGGSAKIPVGGVAFGTTSESGTTSTGETKREGTITGTIAARVLRVLPGGLLEIEGVRETRVNNETQYIVITGLIRPMDIAPDNSIESNRISDAKIAYYGQGVLSEKQKPGWFTRFMDNLWPF